MRGFRVLVTASVCGLAMTVAAHAADPPGRWLPEFKKPFYTDLISGWYVRGDLGYRINDINSVDAPIPTTVFFIENAWTLGFGGGYKYKWFRSDVTLDYGRGFAATSPEYRSSTKPRSIRSRCWQTSIWISAPGPA